MIELWKTLRRVVVTKSPIFEVSVVERQPPFDAPPGKFYVVDLPDWVNVVARTDDGNYVLVRQYRHGTNAVTLEIPGGNVDGADSGGRAGGAEAALAAAKRELLEETGYAADAWVELGVVEPNPAIQSNRCTTFLADGARKVCEPQGDLYEEIEVELVDRAALDALVEAGEIRHALVVAAFHQLAAWERRGAT